MTTRPRWPSTAGSRRGRHIRLTGVASLLLPLGALGCSLGPKGDVDSADTAMPDDTADSDSGGGESADSWTGHEEEALLSVSLGVSVGGLYAVEGAGAVEWMGGPYPADGVVLAWVPAGEWTIYAFDVASDSGPCNRTAPTRLTIGEELRWDVVELPGTYDEAGECILP